jgi:ParB family chromosome partitioning protein
LGRGLAALLGNMEEGAEHGGQEGQQAADQVFDAPPPALGMPPAGAASPAGGQEEMLQLDVDQIDDNPFQPRRDFGPAEITSLAESLKQHDLLQPVLVRRAGERYQLISGERRLRAAVEAGWRKIPARVRKADDRLVAELAIVENLQRKDLNPIEKALSFQRYLDQHRCTQEELAGRLKIDRSTIANLMRLLELPQSVIEAVRTAKLTAGHARALLPLGDDRMQVVFAERIQEHGFSVRETERQVSERIAQEDEEPLQVVGDPGEPPAARPRNDQVASLEQELRSALGTKVDIRQNAKGRGKIVIQFKSHEEFERLRALLTDSDVSPQRRIG